VGVIILGSWMLFNTADLVIDWTWPVLSSSSVFVLTFYYHWARKRRSEWIISRRFGDIVNATVLKQLKQKHTEIKTTGELKEITVMNADLRNFALLAAEYGSNAEGLVSAVHEYMDAILPEIVNNQGTVDKLIGDGIVAFWNAPMDVEYHALKSVKTALNMQRQIDKFNSMLTPEETPLCLDIGINTGVAVVGNTGSRKTFNYTAIGDTVKTADNLERLCKQYGVNILVGEQTVTQINRGHTIQALGYTLIELDTVFMESGNAMRVFTVDYVNYYEGPLNDSHVKQHARMLENYYAGKFDTAIRICKELKAEAKLIDYYTTMISKCKAAKAELQEDPASSI
jgi:adenylate cyclase